MNEFGIGALGTGGQLVEGDLGQTALAGALAATALTSVTPAMAQGYGGYRHRDRGDSTGAAIVAI